MQNQTYQQQCNIPARGATSLWFLMWRKCFLLFILLYTSWIKPRLFCVFVLLPSIGRSIESRYGPSIYIASWFLNGRFPCDSHHGEGWPTFAFLRKGLEFLQIPVIHTHTHTCFKCLIKNWEIICIQYSIIRRLIEFFWIYWISEILIISQQEYGRQDDVYILSLWFGRYIYNQHEHGYVHRIVHWP